MRRRVGVGHVLQERQQQQRMADLGAQITAERVGQIENQLEELQTQLKTLAHRYQTELKEDPIVRARFRQLADSLGVDLISSKKNVFAEVLGLGDFYYQLASRTVESCMQERKFCGAYVPLQRVQFFVQKMYDSGTLTVRESHAYRDSSPHGHNSKKDGREDVKRTTISEADIVTALSKLSVLGAGYNVVKLGGVSYIQTTPDGARGGDQVLLLNYVLRLQKEQIAKAKKGVAAARAAVSQTTVGSASSSLPSGRGTGEGDGGSTRRGAFGAAYVLGAHPFELDSDPKSPVNETLSFTQQCVAARESQIANELRWEVHRARAVLQRMVQEGMVWVEEPEPPTIRRPQMTVAAGGRSAASKGSNRFDEKKKEIWKAVPKGTAEEAERKDVVYWFVSLTSHA